MQRILHYITMDGRDVFQAWLEHLRDSTARARILVRLNRLAAGNCGDCQAVGEGVFELRIHYGPGYRVYFGQLDDHCVLLLLGGDKRQQADDITRAKAYWAEFRRRPT